MASLGWPRMTLRGACGFSSRAIPIGYLSLNFLFLYYSSLLYCCFFHGSVKTLLFYVYNATCLV